MKRGGLTLSWMEINRRIRNCKRLETPQERLSCLMRLYQETADGMVAYALAEELESQGKFEQALKYYEEAERRFPLPRYKLLAEDAIVRVKMKIQERKAPYAKEEMEVEPQINLDKLNPETTLFVVACTQTKVWDENSCVPLYVPARLAYKGNIFRNFLKWAERIKLEEKGFKWIILSAKYGYIEPWHPISNYDVTFNDKQTGPISDETLYSQVMYQKRWGNKRLKDFKTIICFGSQVYLKKVHNSFRDAQAQIIDGLKAKILE